MGLQPQARQSLLRATKNVENALIRQWPAARDQMMRLQSDSGRAVVATFRAIGGGR